MHKDAWVRNKKGQNLMKTKFVLAFGDAHTHAHFNYLWRFNFNRNFNCFQLIFTFQLIPQILKHTFQLSLHTYKPTLLFTAHFNLNRNFELLSCWQFSCFHLLFFKMTVQLHSHRNWVHFNYFQCLHTPWQFPCLQCSHLKIKKFKGFQRLHFNWHFKCYKCFNLNCNSHSRSKMQLTIWEMFPFSSFCNAS